MSWLSIHVSMRDERKKQARSNKQTNKAKQHSTPTAAYLFSTARCHQSRLDNVYVNMSWARARLGGKERENIHSSKLDEEHG